MSDICVNALECESVTTQLKSRGAGNIPEDGFPTEVTTNTNMREEWADGKWSQVGECFHRISREEESEWFQDDEDDDKDKMTASEGRAHQASRLQSNQEKDKRKQLEDAEKTHGGERKTDEEMRFILDLENKHVWTWRTL